MDSLDEAPAVHCRDLRDLMPWVPVTRHVMRLPINRPNNGVFTPDQCAFTPESVHPRVRAGGNSLSGSGRAVLKP